MTESDVQSKILKYLNSLPECVAENVSGNARQSGRADVNGCYKGRCFKIELKCEDTGYQPTKQQLLYLKRWEKAGALVGICHSIEEVKEVLKIESD